MCIAIMNPKKVTLKKQTLRNCWDNNSDGAGMLYVDNGKLKVFKEMDDFNTFYNKYLDIKKTHKESTIVLHFRISTHGKINKTNCHPFLVDKNIGFVHNGIISGMPHSNDFSDTYMFNELYLKKLPRGFEKNEAIKALIEDFIGTNKLIFLDSDNNATIFNEKAGTWDNDCWFSNTTYKYSYDGWVDYGGTKKYAGYGTGYSSNWGSYGKYGTPKQNKYGSHGATPKKDDKPASVIKFADPIVHCRECGITLYNDEVEKHGDICDYCVAEMAGNEVLSDTVYGTAINDTFHEQCECCSKTDAKWNHHFHAYVCDTCMKEFA